MSAKRKRNLERTFLAIFVLMAALAFVAKFGGPGILRMYVEAGLGSCAKEGLFCMRPEGALRAASVDEAYLKSLLTYTFPEMEVLLPRGFTVVKQTVKRPYHKKYTRKQRGAYVYLIYEPPNFFISLFPQVQRDQVLNDYDFIARLMHATTPGIRTIYDAFFVIMKGIFIPDVGDQSTARMIRYNLGDRRGFITYNLGEEENYFDCMCIDDKGNFYKMYIKDTNRVLDIDKVLAIVSSLKEGQSPQ